MCVCPVEHKAHDQERNRVEEQQCFLIELLLVYQQSITYWNYYCEEHSDRERGVAERLLKPENCLEQPNLTDEDSDQSPEDALRHAQKHLVHVLAKLPNLLKEDLERKCFIVTLVVLVSDFLEEEDWN